jgi:hypothetical protein
VNQAKIAMFAALLIVSLSKRRDKADLSAKASTFDKIVGSFTPIPGLRRGSSVYSNAYLSGLKL